MFWLNSNEVTFSIDDRGAAKAMKLNTRTLAMEELIPNFNEQFTFHQYTKESYMVHMQML